MKKYLRKAENIKDHLNLVKNVQYLQTYATDKGKIRVLMSYY